MREQSTSHLKEKCTIRVSLRVYTRLRDNTMQHVIFRISVLCAQLCVTDVFNRRFFGSPRLLFLRHSQERESTVSDDNRAIELKSNVDRHASAMNGEHIIDNND